MAGFWRKFGRAITGSVLENMTPERVPFGPGNIGDPTVALVKFVRHLEHGEHQTALGRAGDMAAAGLAPNELARTHAQTFRWTILVDQPAFEDLGLLDLDVLVVR